MKKTIILLLTVITLCAGAQTENSLLWEISGNGLEQSSYVFGTIHMIPKNDYFFTPEMQTAFNACEVLVIEADMFSLSLSEKINLATQMIFPDGKTLKDYMDSVEYVELKQLLADSIGIKEKKFDKKYARIKPFYLMGVFLPEYVGKIKTYEQELFSYSKKNKMDLKALETIEFQMKLAEGLTIERQIEGLSDMEQYRMYLKMVELYKEQNINELREMALEEYKSESELEFLKLFVDDRNHDWIPKIAAMAKEKSSFIAVGALHLPGENGVLELLIKEGYIVKPVK